VRTWPASLPPVGGRPGTKGSGPGGDAGARRRGPGLVRWPDQCGPREPWAATAWLAVLDQGSIGPAWRTDGKVRGPPALSEIACSVGVEGLCGIGSTELPTEGRGRDPMLSDLLTTVVTTGGSVPVAGAMASEMAFATDPGTPPVAGPGAEGVGVPVAADGSPRAPRPDRVRPTPPEALGSAVEAVGTVAAPAALGNSEKRARQTSTPPKEAAIKTAVRIGPRRRGPATLLSEAPPRAPLKLTKSVLPATEGGEPSGPGAH
jgi:hypothetical protein